MTKQEYVLLFHRANVHQVAFKLINDCDTELRQMVELAVRDARREWCGLPAESELPTEPTTGTTLSRMIALALLEDCTPEPQHKYVLSAKAMATFAALVIKETK